MNILCNKKIFLGFLLVIFLGVGWFGIFGVESVYATHRENHPARNPDETSPPSDEEETQESELPSDDTGGDDSEAPKDFVPLEGIPGVIDAEAAKDPSKFFSGMFTFGIMLSGLLAVIMIAVGGIQYMSTDAVSVKADGRERITYAVMGLLLVLFSWILLNTINPDILKFNLFDTPGAEGEIGENGKTDISGNIPTDIDGKIEELERLIESPEANLSPEEIAAAQQVIEDLKKQKEN